MHKLWRLQREQTKVGSFNQRNSSPASPHESAAHPTRGLISCEIRARSKVLRITAAGNAAAVERSELMMGLTAVLRST